MQNFSKYFGFGILILIIVVLFLFNKDSGPAIPTEVIDNPAGYEDGSKLSLYDKIPPGIPEGIVLEKISTDNSSSITLPDGRVQSKFAYTSGKSLRELVDLHQKSLMEGGWEIVVDANSDRVAVFSGFRGEERLIITIVAEEVGTVVTFQYQ